METRQQKALLTKKKISETAIQLFKEKSFHQVTVDEILKKANSSKGAFYTHFRSKHDIFLDKFKEIDDYYLDEIVEVINKESLCKDKLAIFFRLQMAYIERDLGWDVVRTIYEVELNTERESFFLLPDRPLYSILTGIFKEGQKNGEFRSDLSSAVMLNACLRIMRGILYDWSLHNASFSLEEEQELLFRMMIREFMAEQ
ncbi:TetR/AcrR family transcriptional regulator [Virgibacillus oceani]